MTQHTTTALITVTRWCSITNRTTHRSTVKLVQGDAYNITTSEGLVIHTYESDDMCAEAVNVIQKKIRWGLTHGIYKDHKNSQDERVHVRLGISPVPTDPDRRMVFQEITHRDYINTHHYNEYRMVLLTDRPKTFDWKEVKGSLWVIYTQLLPEEWRSHQQGLLPLYKRIWVGYRSKQMFQWWWKERGR